MNALLTDLLKELNLQPGQCERVIVDGYQVEVRRLQEHEDPWAPMRDLWLAIPQSETALTVQAQRGAPQLPKPIDLDESDLAPE